METEKQLLHYSGLTEAAMEQYMQDERIPAELREVMSYSLFAGGKRLRPALVLAAARLCGGSEEDALPFACAIEMIHTYSLIHDDLPALDNDDLRRGRPTSHKAFDEARAILAGDGLLSLAFEIMLRAVRAGEKSSAMLRAALAVSEAAGVHGMVAGQWVDVRSEGKQKNTEILTYIHENKTAAMIIGALQAGAHTAGADESALAALTRYGAELGLTFQIVDDILDIVGETKELGKKTGSDEANKKLTYVTRFGLEGAFAQAQAHTAAAVKALEAFDGQTEFLEELAKYMLNRKK